MTVDCAARTPCVWTLETLFDTLDFIEFETYAPYFKKKKMWVLFYIFMQFHLQVCANKKNF